MSLDLYIISMKPVRHRGTGVFVREDGQNKELKTIDEVKERFPDADLSNVNVYDYEDDELFHMNLTHNLVEMAQHVPIANTDGVLTLPRDYEKNKQDWKPKPLSAYNLLWHPETNPMLTHQTIHKKNDDGEEYEMEVTRITPELVRQLMAVSFYINNHQKELEKYNPENGWGTYEQFRDRTNDLMMAVCKIPFDEHYQYYLYCWT